jgi:hypothetical protein
MYLSAEPYLLNHQRVNESMGPFQDCIALLFFLSNVVDFYLWDMNIHTHEQSNIQENTMKVC